MEATSPNAHLEEQSPDQVELAQLSRLIELYRSQPEIMDALALAWRLGFTRARIQNLTHMHSSYINPFWL
jgi:hypothetical protein